MKIVCVLIRVDYPMRRGDLRAAYFKSHDPYYEDAFRLMQQRGASVKPNPVATSKTLVQELQAEVDEWLPNLDAL